LCRFSRDDPAFGRRHGFSSGGPAFLTTQATASDSRDILAIIDFVLDLTGSDIDDEVPELHRVARALETTGCHAGNMARCVAVENASQRLL